MAPADPLAGPPPARLADPTALERLFPAVYDELCRLAQRHLRRERGGHTLNTTALVHEAYLRLAEQTRVDWQDRGHFLAVAAQAMRRVLVDHARRHRAAKRGGDRQRVSLDEAMIVLEERAEMLLALDQALERLEALDARLCRVVECRFFSGMTEVETAAVLQVTPRTVQRDWTRAKAWLYHDLHD